MQVGSLGQEDPLEYEMATHSSIFAWKIAWTEESGGLHNSWGCRELDMTEHTHTHTHTQQVTIMLHTAFNSSKAHL